MDDCVCVSVFTVRKIPVQIDKRKCFFHFIHDFHLSLYVVVTLAS